MNITQKIINELNTLKDKIHSNKTFTYQEKIDYQVDIDIAIDALIKLDKIKNIQTECSNCDDDRTCASCGAYLEFEKEVNRILEGVK